MSECDACICQDCPKRTEAIPTGVCGMCDVCEKDKAKKPIDTYCAWKKEG